MRAAALLAFALTACCAGSPPPDAPPLPGPTSITPPPPITSIAGRWSSPSCGKRGYERLVTFSPTGTFTSEDRVSPCPPNARCIWAGIVFHKGRYTTAGGAITLTLEGPQASQGQPLPAGMTLDPSGAPVETGSDGSACVYVAVKP